MAPPRARARRGKGSLIAQHGRLASYEEPSLLHDVLSLLSDVFPFFEAQERAARALGLRWESCSTPFVSEEDGRVVSHVGVLETPVVFQGRERTLGNLHGVATREAARRRGFFRAAIERALAWCDARYETLQLATDDPQVFEPFGFRIVQEHHFVLPAPRRRGTGAAPAAALDDPRALAHLLERRAPVSETLGTRDRQVILFNEARRPPLYAPDLDAVICGEIRGGRLVIDDVVAERVPRLSALVERLPPDFDEIELHFAPDRVAPDDDAVAVPDSTENDVLMVRGPFPVGDQPCKLPPTARC